MITYLLMGVLLFVFIQDLKFKAVYWVLFPFIFALALFSSWNELSLAQLGLNALSLFTLLLGLTLYLTLKERKLVNPTQGYFAWGDIFFLISILPLFNLYSYLFYFISGTLFVLTVHSILLLLKKANKEIPYAGYMSIYLVGVLLFCQYYKISIR